MSSPQSAPDLTSRTCPCGHSVGHHMVSAEAEYSGLGWLLVAIGVSARPVRVKYRCRRCEEVFGVSTDAELLSQHY